MVKLFDDTAGAPVQEPATGDAPPAALAVGAGTRGSGVVPICSPTRACFLAGRNRHRSG